MKKIIFLTTFISSLNCVIAQNTAGDSLFNALQIHTIEINFSSPNYWTDLVNNKAYDDANDSSTYIPATVTINGIQLDSVGIQFKGNSSYYNYPGNKKPFTLSFDEYDTLQKYDGLKSVNLNNMYQDPSFMREKLFLDFCNEKGLYAPRCNYAKLYINGSYWGFYYVSERVNKTFLKDRFDNKSGNLFKGDGSGSACATLEYHGLLSSYYNCYTLRTNKTLNDWSDLIDLTYQINSSSSTQLRDSLEATMNTNSFIGAWAAYNLFCDFDSYPYRFVHNYYTYHNTASDKFEWIVWDVSTAFGMDIPMTIPQIESTSVLYLSSPLADHPLCNRMLADSSYRDAYLQTVCSFASNDFLSNVLNPKIDSIYNFIKNDVYSDPLKMYSNTNFDNNINSNITVNSIDYPGLKSFIQNRSASVVSELSGLGYSNCASISAGVNELENDIKEITIYPNPSTDKFIVSSSEPITELKIFDSTGRNIFSEKTISQAVEVSAPNENGIYLLQIFTEKNMITKRIIIQK